MRVTRVETRPGKSSRWFWWGFQGRKDGGRERNQERIMKSCSEEKALSQSAPLWACVCVRAHLALASNVIINCLKLPGARLDSVCLDDKRITANKRCRPILSIISCHYFILILSSSYSKSVCNHWRSDYWSPSYFGPWALFEVDKYILLIFENMITFNVTAVL